MESALQLPAVLSNRGKTIVPAVEEITRIEQLAGYRLHWDVLLRQTPEASFFQTLDWLESYWEHCGEGQRLRVLVVYSQNKPIGILPLVIRTERTRVGPVRVLTYPLHDWGSFYGPIGPNPTATLLVGLKYIRRTRRNWDVLDLRWVNAAGHDLGRTPRAMHAAGFHPHEQPWMQTAVIEMSGGWETYWSGRPKKFRHNVQRLTRRLQEQGRIRYVRYRPRGAAEGDGDPQWDLYEACCGVAKKSWQGASHNGTTLCHCSVSECLRSIHAAAARAGCLDMNLLFLDEVPIAFSYNYVYRGNVYALRKGYDPKWAKVGPGTVMQAMMLEDSFRRGDHLFDLGPGSLQWKRDWLTSVLTSYRYTHFPAWAPRAQLLRLKRLWLDTFSTPEAVLASRQ